MHEGTDDKRPTAGLTYRRKNDVAAMQTYDLTLKDLLMDGAPVLLQQTIGFADVRLAPMEVPVIGGGRLDLFGEIDDTTALHIELQADNDLKMTVRMLGYLWFGLRQKPGLQVRQMVLYVGRDPMSMPDRLKGPGITYHYDLIDAHNLQAESLLASDHPCDIIMAFFAATDDMKARVRAVVRRLTVRLAHDPQRLKDALVRLSLLSSLRRAEPVVQEEISAMPITIDLETHPFASTFFLKGRAEGKAEGKFEGKAEILLRQLVRRFGPLDGAVENRIRAANSELLDIWCERIFDVVNVDDIFNNAARR